MIAARHAVGIDGLHRVEIGGAGLYRLIRVGDGLDALGQHRPVGAVRPAEDVVGHRIGGGLPGDHDGAAAGLGRGQLHLRRDGIKRGGADAGGVIAALHAVGIDALHRVGIGGAGLRCLVRVGGGGDALGQHGPVGAVRPAEDIVGHRIGGGLPGDGDAVRISLGVGQLHQRGIRVEHGGAGGGAPAAAQQAVLVDALDVVEVGRAAFNVRVLVAGLRHVLGNGGPARVLGGRVGAAVHEVGIRVGGLGPRHRDAADTGLCRHLLHIGGDGIGHPGADAGGVEAGAGPAVDVDGLHRIEVGGADLRRLVRVGGGGDTLGQHGPVGAVRPAEDVVGHRAVRGIPCDGDAVSGGPGLPQRHIRRSGRHDPHRDLGVLHRAVVHGLQPIVRDGVHMGLDNGELGLIAPLGALLDPEGQGIQVAGDGETGAGGIQ